MPAIAIIGAQWGDEGKGAITDRESERSDLVVRFNGAPNAGHTLFVDGEKIVTHALPSGIVRPGMMCLVGPMVACGLPAIEKELAIANRFDAQVRFDRRAPIILPFHQLLDKAQDQALGQNAIGTTGQGVGPCYSDFWARRGLKLGDLTNENSIAAALSHGNYYQEKLALAKHYGFKAPSLDETITWCSHFVPIVKPRLADTVGMVHQALAYNKRVLFEGAQGVLLDPFCGAYPFTTSSLCTIAGIEASFGVHHFDQVIGVVKAYSTRVGGGPFPTELTDEMGERLRQKGGEFGATTGRPRRCGWLDMVALRYACQRGGITELFVTKLDVLEDIDPIRYCIGYHLPGRKLDPLETLTLEVMQQAKPQYKVFRAGEGMKGLRNCRSFKSLPEAAKRYLKTISEYTKIPITGVGVGPGRDEWFAM